MTFFSHINGSKAAQTVHDDSWFYLVRSPAVNGTKTQSLVCLRERGNCGPQTGLIRRAQIQDRIKKKGFERVFA